MKRRSLSNTARAKLFEAHGGVCHICSAKIQAGEAWEAEHVIPLAIGGEDGGDNLKPAHVKCHASKTKRDRQTISKTERMRLKNIGAWRSPHPMNWRKRRATPSPHSQPAER